jgi:hypothetical protein
MIQHVIVADEQSQKMDVSDQIWNDTWAQLLPTGAPPCIHHACLERCRPEVLAAAAIAAGSLTLAGFGLDSLIGIGAFIVVVELRGGHGVSTDGGGQCRLELG